MQNRLLVGVVSPKTRVLDGKVIAAPGSTYVRLVDRLRDYVGRSVRYEFINSVDENYLKLVIFSKKFDVLLIQRNAIKDLAIVDEVILQGIKVVYEIDDDLVALGKNSKKGDTYYNCHLVIEKLLSYASLVTVSTEVLKVRFNKYNSNIIVIPNSINIQRWCSKSDSYTSFFSNINKDNFNVLYMGSNTHQSDLLLLKEAVQKIKTKYSRFKLYIIGVTNQDSDWYDVISMPDECKEYPNFVKFVKQAAKYMKLGVAPLEDGYFQQAKSCLKFFEYSALSLPAICSNVTPYKEAVRHGENGFLVDNTVDSWSKQLESMIATNIPVVECQSSQYVNYIKDVDYYDNLFIEVFNNQHSNNKVIVGAEEYLFLTNDSNNSIKQFTGELVPNDGVLKRWLNHIQANFNLAENIQLLIAPSKEYILLDKYPHMQRQKSAIEVFLDHFKSSINYPQQSLMAHAVDAYYKTDTHWSDFGAFIAAREILIRYNLSDFINYLSDRFISKEVVGDLGVKCRPEKSSQCLKLKDTVHPSFDNGINNNGRILVYDNELAPVAETLVIFGDSFSSLELNSFLDVQLSFVFSRVVFVHCPVSIDFSILEYENPKYILLEIQQRFIISAPANRNIWGVIEKKLTSSSYALVDKIIQKINGYNISENKNTFYKNKMLGVISLVQSKHFLSEGSDHSLVENVVSLNDIVMYPFRIMGYYFCGGILSNNLHENARMKRARNYADKLPDVLSKSEELFDEYDGSYLYGGPLYMHFGHIMTESIHRLYAYNEKIHKGVVFAIAGSNEERIQDTNIPNFLALVLEIFQIEISRVILVKKPTKFQHIEIAKPGSALGNGPESWYFKILSNIQNRIVTKLNNKFPKKILLGRRHIIQKGSFIGESYFEALLSKNGFIYIKPEEFDIIRQCGYLINAEFIVFTEGSGIYSCELLSYIHAKVRMIPRRSKEPNYVPHLKDKCDFRVLGNLNDIKNLKNKHGKVGPNSPGISLSPDSIFDDLQSSGFIDSGVKFSLEEFKKIESSELLLYAGNDNEYLIQLHEELRSLMKE